MNGAFECDEAGSGWEADRKQRKGKKKKERKDRTCGIHVVLDLVHQIRIDRVDASHQMRRLDERRSRVVPVRLGGQGGRRWFWAFDYSEGRHWEVENQFFYDRGSG